MLLRALSLGAEVIEKHYTFDKRLPGNDHYHSFDRYDLDRFNQSLCYFLESAGDLNLDIQFKARRFARRGIYAKRNILAGAMIAIDDLIPLRPALDFIEGSDIYTLVGQTVKRDISKGEGISHFDLEA